MSIIAQIITTPLDFGEQNDHLFNKTYTIQVFLTTYT
jgi:hypothetical protein